MTAYFPARSLSDTLPPSDDSRLNAGAFLPSLIMVDGLLPVSEACQREAPVANLDIAARRTKIGQ